MVLANILYFPLFLFDKKLALFLIDFLFFFFLPRQKWGKLKWHFLGIRDPFGTSTIVLFFWWPPPKLEDTVVEVLQPTAQGWSHTEEMRPVPSILFHFDSSYAVSGNCPSPLQHKVKIVLKFQLSVNFVCPFVAFCRFHGGGFLKCLLMQKFTNAEVSITLFKERKKGQKFLCCKAIMSYSRVSHIPWETASVWPHLLWHLQTKFSDTSLIYTMCSFVAIMSWLFSSFVTYILLWVLAHLFY